MSDSYIPDRGDMIWISLDPQAGHESRNSGRRRPVLVLSPAAYNGKVGLAILCPITNQIKGYPYEVEIPSGLAVSGVILSDQVKSLDWKVRKAEFICKLLSEITTEVQKKLYTLIRALP